MNVCVQKKLKTQIEKKKCVYSECYLFRLVNDFGGCDGVGVGVGDDGDGYDDGGNGGDGVQCKHSMHLNGLRLQ